MGIHVISARTASLVPNSIDKHLPGQRHGGDAHELLPRVQPQPVRRVEGHSDDKLKGGLSELLKQFQGWHEFVGKSVALALLIFLAWRSHI